MALQMTISLLFMYYFVGFAVNAQNADEGKILIGAQRNGTDPTEYVYSTNVTNDQGLPFTAVVYSGADGSIATKEDTVTVTCENDFAGVSGYTQLSFGETSLNPADSEGSVVFNFK
ncbi:uncharacterized protein [Littorina saxatilis]|uniref:uncharacterized protein n=1 Tax=Littorina saxatilis TaxID=31220 RepID=UPI0038B4899F